jgi:hypothetical protein
MHSEDEEERGLEPGRWPAGGSVESMRSRITEAEMNENLPGRFVDVNGAALYYEEHGDGDPNRRRARLQRSMGAGRPRARRRLPGDHAPR